MNLKKKKKKKNRARFEPQKLLPELADSGEAKPWAPPLSGIQFFPFPVVHFASLLLSPEKKLLL